MPGTPNVRRDDFYLMSDSELAAELDKVRVTLALNQPITGQQVRCMEEAARRLHILIRMEEKNSERSPANDG